MTLSATVIKNAGSHFLLTDFPKWKPFPAVLKGKVRMKKSSSTNPVAVGDKVEFEIPDNPVNEDNMAIITKILPRSNYIIRRSANLSKESHVIAANLDMVVAVVTLFFPETKLPFLDRLMVTCELYKIPVTIVLNKVDMYRDECPDMVETFKNIYTGAGYRVLETSARTGEGIAELRGLCHDKICLLSGESGVGKSSLIRALDPSLSPRTGEISDAHLQGRHTTSLYEMYRLDCGGYVIDTPGLRGFGLVDIEKEEIYKYFPEMLKESQKCRFTPCSHTHEPGCAVKAAVDKGIISTERYNSYLGMLEEDTKFRQ